MSEEIRNEEVEVNETENVEKPEVVKTPFWKKRGIQIATGVVAGLAAAGGIAFGLIRGKVKKGSGAGSIDEDVEDLGI
jgi:uncharacterized protein involved in exopolysaccharide biosynthesis